MKKLIIVFTMLLNLIIVAGCTKNNPLSVHKEQGGPIKMTVVFLVMGAMATTYEPARIYQGDVFIDSVFVNDSVTISVKDSVGLVCKFRSSMFPTSDYQKESAVPVSDSRWEINAIKWVGTKR